MVEDKMTVVANSEGLIAPDTMLVVMDIHLNPALKDGESCR